MKVSDVVLDILTECRAEGNVVYLPERQLDRQTYLAVNKALECIGGKWNRKQKGHVFSHGNPAEMLESLILTGDVVDLKKEFQFFPTPRPVALRMCQWQNWMKPASCWSRPADVEISQMLSTRPA